MAMDDAYGKDDWRPPVDPEAEWDDEADQNGYAHQLTLGPYLLSRYPVTVGQFRAFYDRCPVDAEGRRYWRMTWREPAPGEYSGTLDPACVAAPDSRPVTDVSWYDALAYCAWLTAALRADVTGPTPAAWTRTKRGEVLARLLTTADPERGGRQWVVTLPSEAEWEKGARGPGGWMVRPWDVPDPERASSSLDPTRANYWWDEEEGQRTGAGVPIEDPSTVGAFPAGRRWVAPGEGAPPTSPEDLIGNVWEWTRSLARGGLTSPDSRYPYPESEQAWAREDPTAGEDVGRVVRGGSFGDLTGFLRSASRSYLRPRFRYFNGGFRVVVAPFAFDPLISVPLTSDLRRG